MKKYIIFLIIILIHQQVFSQLFIAPGGKLEIKGNTDVTIQNMSLVNNGTFNSGNGTVHFTGTANNNIEGSSSIEFHDLEMNKTAAAVISLLQNISIKNSINFTSGNIDLNQKNITLASTAFLNNENESSHIKGDNGGEILITLNMNAPGNLNPGNLGALISSAQNLGSVTIRRGHKIQSGTGLTSSINRYYNIQPSNNINLNATLRFQYLDAEKNTQNESALELYISSNNGTSWLNQNFTSKNPATNFVEKTGLSSLSLFTLSANGSVVPVTGLDFMAKRISKTNVQLNWKTIQEINNKGFHIERKKENENNFSAIGFVNSNAVNGNSNFGLDYQQLDNNSYTGSTYYRLKQEDLDGRTNYSVVRLVKGDISNQTTMQVWPLPATGYFNVKVTGLEKDDQLLIFDMNGRMVQKLLIQNQSQLRVNGLPAGTYFVKLGSDPTIGQKVIVQ